MKDAALLIFIKNPVLGKVKTRLASTVGKEKALAVYGDLCDIARETSSTIACPKFLYWSDTLPKDAGWGDAFHNRVQEGEDLGERMKMAFAQTFAAGYRRVVLIGTDIPFLTEAILNEAFSALNENPLCIGPSADGGYYLIGLTEEMPDLFSGMPWSTDRVLAQTIRRAQDQGKQPYMLPVLYDIDTEDDFNLWQAQLAHSK